MREKLFISYRRLDAAHSAGRLRDVLNDVFPKRVFVDVEDIEPGADFARTIESSLLASAAVIVVIGQKWLEGSISGARLGDPDDIVTLEILTALRLRRPILPVLVDGASMPLQSQVPAEFAPLLRVNAVSIRHSSFRRDCEEVIAYSYKSLRLVPPTALERMLEWIASKTGYGDRFRVDERMRRLYANFAVGLGLLCFVASTLSIVLDGRSSDILFASALVVLIALIGKNSREARSRAIVGLVTGALAFGISCFEAIRSSLQ